MTERIHHDDSRLWLDTLEAESFAACVTDPPYELGFMGKDWDKRGVASDPDFWRKVFRVLKPGAHLAAFGGTRTYHRLTCAIEDAGFEIRDGLMWLYGQGFPKSHDVSKAIDKAAGAERKKKAGGRGPGWQRAIGNTRPWMDDPDHMIDGDVPATPEAAAWDGWGTALKPAWEPIILARKPLAGTVAANVLEHGTGAMHVGACRVAVDGNRDAGQLRTMKRSQRAHDTSGQAWGLSKGGDDQPPVVREEGRWPANVILQHSPECVEVNADLWACVPGCPVRMMDEQSGVLKAGVATRRHKGYRAGRGAVHFGSDNPGMRQDVTFGDTGGASRFFYNAKASTAERSAGLPKGERNMHPTVKPVDVMRWLVRLLTPVNGTVLEPFAGSGTTCCACELEGFAYAACEQDKGHVRTARLRAAHWLGVAEKAALAELNREPLLAALEVATQ